MARPRKREGWVKRSWLKKMVTLKKWGYQKKKNLRRPTREEPN